jgi:hypothetical protein
MPSAGKGWRDGRSSRASAFFLFLHRESEMCEKLARPQLHNACVSDFSVIQERLCSNGKSNIYHKLHNAACNWYSLR